MHFDMLVVASLVQTRGTHPTSISLFQVFFALITAAFFGAFMSNFDEAFIGVVVRTK